MRARLVALVVAGLVLAPAVMAAQVVGALKGKVINDANDAPIAGAEVSIPGIKAATQTEADGSFILRGVPPGKHIVWVRKIGFEFLSAVLAVAPGDTVDNDFGMFPSRSQRLPEVEVKAEKPVVAKLSDFEERRKMGLGHFITQDQLDKQENRRMSEILGATPGASIVRGNTNAAWVSSGRGVATVENQFVPDRYDIARGAKRGVCYMAVMIDGVTVFSGNSGETLFDINSLQPNSIAAIEVYSGGATIPAKYNGTKAACGLVLIWTR
jgi:hypothetical protein